MVNYTVGAVLLILALIYLVKPSFMPYHSQALSLEWNEVDLSTQNLILALMRVCGGGWLTIAITIIFLQWRFSRTKEPWIPGLILIVALVSTLSTLYATLLVWLNTPGNPPIPGLLILICLILIGYRLNVAEAGRFKVT